MAPAGWRWRGPGRGQSELASPSAVNPGSVLGARPCPTCCCSAPGTGWLAQQESAHLSSDVGYRGAELPSMARGECEGGAVSWCLACALQRCCRIAHGSALRFSGVYCLLPAGSPAARLRAARCLLRSSCCGHHAPSGGVRAESSLRGQTSRARARLAVALRCGVGCGGWCWGAALGHGHAASGKL
jgi:hypothetical protein